MLRLILAAMLLVGLVAKGYAGEFAGKYKGEKLSAEIQDSAPGYVGTLVLGDKHFPLKGDVRDGKFEGTFQSNGTNFAFTATLAGDHLTLSTGGVTYQLERPVSGPVNPLADGDGAPASGDVPAGYTVVASASGGKAIFVQKPEATTADAAMRATFADLDHVFDGRPSIGGAFADMKDNRSGGAFFTAKLKGQDVRGSVFCGVGVKGAAVTVVYDRKDAPPEEWNKLIAALPSQTTMHTYNFLDGTGSVDLPEGWKTSNQSCVGGVRIVGPAGQVVTLGQGAEVSTPDSPMMQLHNQLIAQARQMGNPPPPPIAMLVAPYSEPVEALKILAPQIDHFSRQSNGPGIRLDRIIEATDATATLPNGKASLIYFAWTKTDKRTDTPYRSLSQLETYVVGQGAWGTMLTELAAPDQSFDKDIVVMRQIASSFKVNDQAVTQVTQNMIQANNQRFAAMQQAHKEQNAAFDRLNESWRNRELSNSRSNADFDEVIRGYRTVENTATGERSSVDLGSATQVVDKLNEANPGRYKEIPLRDEMYPVPGQ